MANQEEDKRHAGRYNKDIHEAKQRCKDIFTECNRYKSGSVPFELKEALAAATRNYYEELREYKDDSQLAAERWEESDVDEIPKLHNTYVLDDVPAPGDTDATKKVRRIALIAMNPEEVNQYINQLDDIRHALSFAADVEDETPHTEAGHSDLVELAQVREQDETVDKIPGDG